MAADPGFWRGKRVLLTGHTGFKGAWAALWLTAMGAEVYGFARPPDTDPALFDLIETRTVSITGDLRDADAVTNAVRRAEPQIVLHLAAQALVRRGYRDPVETYATNTMGTVHLLDALRRIGSASVILVVTTDKVYANDESGRAFREDDRLGGHDPYAASKAAAELVTASYRDAFFAGTNTALISARGGNVIGGGDFSEDRLIPDIVRAMTSGHPVQLRHPEATRPWQHVLDCLDGYLTFVQAVHGQRQDHPAPKALNIGPHDPADTMTVAQVAMAMANALGIAQDWAHDRATQPHEMAALALDPAAARQHLNWQGRLNACQAIRLTAEWYGAWANGADMTDVTHTQIAAYQTRTEDHA